MAFDVTSIFTAIGAVFKWLTGRSDLANSPEMKKRKAAQAEQTQQDKGAAQIAGAAKGDPNAMRDLRNDLSE